MKKVLLTLIAALMLNACSESKPVSLNGKNFVLANDSAITLSFDTKANKFAGKVLNNYFGTYTIDKDTIKFGPIASTMMAGPEAEMKKEQAYFQDLNKVTTYSLKDKILELKGNGVSLKYLEK